MLDDLSLTIAAGERVGVVGRSGAGKSTLVSLLLRFHDVEGGRITIDGQDLREVTQESLRAAIGVVTQDTSMLHRSIAANIRYGGRMRLTPKSRPRPARRTHMSSSSGCATGRTARATKLTLANAASNFPGASVSAWHSPA